MKATIRIDTGRVLALVLLLAPAGRALAAPDGVCDLRLQAGDWSVTRALRLEPTALTEKKGGFHSYAMRYQAVFREARTGLEIHLEAETGLNAARTAMDPPRRSLWISGLGRDLLGRPPLVGAIAASPPEFDMIAIELDLGLPGKAPLWQVSGDLRYIPAQAGEEGEDLLALPDGRRMRIGVHYDGDDRAAARLMALVTRGELPAGAWLTVFILGPDGKAKVSELPFDAAGLERLRKDLLSAEQEIEPKISNQDPPACVQPASR